MTHCPSISRRRAHRPAYRLRFLTGLALLLVLGACARNAEPDAKVFGTAMTTYLAQRGDLCLAKPSWPIDLTQHEIDTGARNALQLPVLERLGLAASTVAEVDVNDEGTLHHMKVRRYELTDAGRKSYVVRGAKGDFCAARLSLDRVVGWQLRADADGKRRHALVTYTYHADAAPWTHDPQAQQVFPMVARVVNGAGTAQLQEAFTFTDQGWVADDLLGS
ncbi:MAG: hypothetical protein JWP43_1254 [Ramlibacter sp.]|nr:hypothetical protein [Ramlibacter sp.]